MSTAERTTEQIREQKFRVFSEQSGRCFSCGKTMAITTMQLAHRISKSKPNLKLWGPEVIHHRMNLRGTHPDWCNDHVSLNPDSIEAERLVYEIQKELKKAKDKRYRRW